MFNTTGSVLRGDLNTVVEQAAQADQFFIGEKLFPQYGVERSNGQYPKMTIATGELLTAAATDRRPNTAYGQIVRKWTSDTYDCVDRGLEEAVDDTTQKLLSPYFEVESATARWVLRNVKLAHETRVAAEIVGANAATNWGAGTAAKVNYTYTLASTVDFVWDVHAAVERLVDNGIVANTIVMSSTVLQLLKQTTVLQNYIRGTSPVVQRNPINAQSLAMAFNDIGIENVYVGRARYNSAKKGQAYSAAAIWGTTYIWVGRIESGDPYNGGAGRTFTWNAEGGLWVTESYRDEKTRSNVIRVRQNTSEHVIDSACGTLITLSYSAS